MHKVRTIFTKRFSAIRFRLMDLIGIGYFGLIGILVIFFHQSVSQWYLFSLFHLLIIVAILEIVRIGELYSHQRILWFIRTFYPIVLVMIGWSEVGNLSLMFFNDYWATDVIIRFDNMIFGVHPTIWVQQFYRPWLDEIMHFFYNIYFLFMPVVSLILFVKGRYEETFAVFALGMGAHITNFLLFFLFPALAPFMVQSMVPHSIDHYSGYLFYFITTISQANGAQAGGTFPSCHVSAALAWSLAAFRYEKKLGYVLLTLTIGVAVSTVYLGHHYALDPIFGLLWGIIYFPIALKILKIRGEDPKLSCTKKRVR